MPEITEAFAGEVAAHLASLAESDRDARHYDPTLVDTLWTWARLKLPGCDKLEALARELHDFLPTYLREVEGK